MASVGEFILVLVAVVLALIAPLSRLRRKRRRDSIRSWNRLASHTGSSMLLVFGVSLAAHLLAAGLGGVPAPAVHDEFSYLLQADTFSSGRLTNPTHPLADMLATPHVLQTPSYQSKYPPGQGIVLAIGQVLIGLPLLGVWTCQAVACAAIYWALRGWAPPRWALLGGLLAAGSYSIITHWGMSYWGGGLALLGGAMAFGTVPRIAVEPTWRHGLTLGLGIAIFTVTRPYEGLIATIPILAECIRIYWQHDRPGRRTITATVLPVALSVVGAALAANVGYNWSVTGEAWKLPYMVWSEQQYGDAWMGEASDDGSRGLLFGATDWWGHHGVLTKIHRQFRFYASPALVPALLGACFLWRCGKTRFAVAATAFVMIAVLAEDTAGYPHYTAPVGVLFFAIVIQGFRRLTVWRWRGVRAGLSLSRSLPLVYAVCLLAGLVVDWAPHPHPPGHAWSQKRADVVRQLDSTSGRHLVLVRYRSDHGHHFEWAYNRARIDDAKTVWIREPDAKNVERIRAYFPNRQVWLLDADERDPTPRRESEFIAASP